MKVKAPFPQLPSFLASANIMSYFGFKDEIEHVLSRLNKNSQIYYICHQDLVSQFLTPWTPEFNQTLCFGQTTNCWDRSSPDVEGLSKLPSYKPIHLRTIRIKSERDSLIAIQLEFTNSFKTDLMELAPSRDAVERTIDVDPSRPIKKIGVATIDD